MSCSACLLCSSRDRHAGQSYKSIVRKATRSGQKFIDPTFPTSDSSLWKKEQIVAGGIEWKRPTELVEAPKLFIDGISSDDVVQGEVGNCWFVAACSVLVKHRSMFNKVLPYASDQEYKPAKPHPGVFVFCFWRFGKWTEVVIDDRLPTRNGRLVFAKSKERMEFWSSLLEKAFAKLYGSYESLVGGTLAEGLCALSGGVPEALREAEFQKYRSSATDKAEIFKTLKEYSKSSALMAAAVDVNSSLQKRHEASLPNGLVIGHAYGITAVKEIRLDAESGLLERLLHKEGRLEMMRLRNPWGEKEWNGPWSDGSAEWKQVTKSQQEKLGIKIEDDGEFWMTFDDFIANFTGLTICHTFNTGFFPVPFETNYKESVFQGMWRLAEGLANRAGGCTNSPDTFLCNPQYRFDIDNETSQVIIHLMQEPHRHTGNEAKAIGMSVLEIEANRITRLHSLPKEVTSATYIKAESSFLRLVDLKPGRYAVVPTTFQPGELAKFLMRFYSINAKDFAELEHIEPKLPFSFKTLFKKPPPYTAVTKVTIESLRNIEEASSKIKPYCIVRCESSHAESRPVKTLESSSELNFTCIFFRRNPELNVTVEIMNEVIGPDAFLGSAEIPSSEMGKNFRHDLTLKDKEGKEKQGSIIVSCCTFQSLTHF